MPKTLVIFDGNCICHRAFHAIKYLQTEDVLTGVVFGFFRDILQFQKRYATNDFVFCFDQGISLRVNTCPSYKSGRRAEYQKASDEEKNKRDELYRQMFLIRDKYLAELGFNNVIYKEGFEADDFIASVCLYSTHPEDDVIIISSDHDLYQLLNHQVSILHPGKNEKFVSRKTFIETYGVSPRQWVDVKAMAGEKSLLSDNIPGIAGIGEGNAAKYLRGELKHSSKAYRSIIEGTHIWQKNLITVTLPFSGTPIVELKENTNTPQKWRALTQRLGMPSLEILGV